MIVPNQLIEIMGNSKNLLRYRGLGYDINVGQVALIKPEDLPPSSHARVHVICDNCGKELCDGRGVVWQNYSVQHNRQQIDLCKDCKTIKTKKTCNELYQGNSPMCNKKIQEKASATCRLHFHCDYPMQNRDILNKAEQTNLRKYGYRKPIQNAEIRNRAAQTNLERYGLLYSFLSQESLEKARETKKARGYQIDSKPERQVYSLLCKIYGENCCISQFQFQRYFFDVLLDINDCKIDVEYDGEYWHERNRVHDEIRDHILIQNGYKILRIKTSHLVPDEEQLKSAIDKLSIQNEDYVQIILSDSKYYNQ